MAVLMVGLGVLAVLMSVAMPVWRQASQREKEEEYLFRANQYARAITLFQRKRANAFPNSIDELMSSNNERYLRKKYKDPITGEDFEFVRQGSQAAGAGLPGGPSGRSGQTTTTPSNAPAGSGRGSQPGQFGSGQTFGGGPIIGVVSKSKAESVRIYKGRTHYNEWLVTYLDYRSAFGGRGNQGQPGQPGVPGGIPGAPGGPTMPGRGTNPPGRGTQPVTPGFPPNFPMPGRGMDVPPRGGQPFPMPPGRGRGGQ